MNPFLRYLADKNSAHRHTDRHTPMTTRPCAYGVQVNIGYFCSFIICIIYLVLKIVKFVAVNL